MPCGTCCQSLNLETDSTDLCPWGRDLSHGPNLGLHRERHSEPSFSEVDNLASCHTPGQDSGDPNPFRHTMGDKKGQDIEAWRQVFQTLIQEVKPWHKWTLTADKGLLPNVLQPGWMQYQLWTFARFQCSSCSRSWASAHVQVLFHMHWSEKKHRGQVKMRVFAQRCKKCPQPPFEVPEFTQENISRVLNNLVIRILKKCYREGFKIVEEIPAIKDICLQGPHDSKNCEACLQGSCAQSGLGLAKESPVPTPSKDAGEPRLTATGTNLPCSQSASRVDKILTPAVSLKVSNPPKADPKVIHSSEPPTAPRIVIPQVPPMSTVSPQISNPPKADPKVRHSSEPPTAPRFLTPQVSPRSTVNPKVPDSPKADPNVRHSSKPPTAPRFPTQQVPPRSSLPPMRATRMPSPTNNTATDAAARVTRPKTGNPLPSSSLLAMPTSTTNLPTSWSPEANATCQMESRIQIYPESGHFYSSRGHFYSSPFQNCVPGRLSTSCCCLLLIIVVVVTMIMVKNTF
ncbi:receptor-transporting protein 3 isoform X1 [Marmota flaviventris]|uniref:receptor-transporting protein 3 isoform X1 n=2 Tax=Marmota flaviventris TaxID=93162 RepID=UPI003A88BC3A